MEGSSVPLVASKISSAILIALVALGGYSIPIIVFKRSKVSCESKQYEKVICLLNCFAAGAIMGMTFFHLIPETIHACEHSSLFIKLGESVFNFCYPLFLCGASMVLLAEHVIATRDCHPCPDIHGKRNVKFNESVASICTVDQNNGVDASKCTSITCPGHECNDLGMFEEVNIAEPETIRVNLLERIRNMCKCRGFFLAIALIFHSVFEGMAIGSSDSHAHVWLLLLGIALHKWATAMALSISLYSGNNKKALFSLATPLGIGIGMGIANTGDLGSGIMNSLTVGTLIYIGAEIISHEFSATGFGSLFPLYQWLTTIAGSILMLVLVIIDLLYIPHHH